jgi:hypothetical protein
MGAEITFSASIAVAIGLVTAVFLMGWLKDQYAMNIHFLKWLVLPLIGFGLALGVNSIINYITCKKVNISQISYSSIFVLVSVLIFIGLSGIGFLQSPILSAVPQYLHPSYGTVLVLAFYMFWAAMFGEGIASGFAQGCGQ